MTSCHAFENSSWLRGTSSYLMCPLIKKYQAEDNIRRDKVSNNAPESYTPQHEVLCGGGKSCWLTNSRMTTLYFGISSGDSLVI